MPFIESHSQIYDALSQASALSDFELCKVSGEHVNWFNFQKCKSFLTVSGFNNVKLSAYGQSIFVACRDTRYFDRTDTSMSFYVDAVK